MFKVPVREKGKGLFFSFFLLFFTLFSITFFLTPGLSNSVVRAVSGESLSDLQVTPTSRTSEVETSYTFIFTAPDNLTAFQEGPGGPQGNGIFVEVFPVGEEDEMTIVDLVNCQLGDASTFSGVINTDADKPREANVVLSEDIAAGTEMVLELEGVVNPEQAGQYQAVVSVTDLSNPEGEGVSGQASLLLGYEDVATLSGAVTYSDTGDPVSGARININPLEGGSSNFSVDTDSAGEYSVLLPSGSWRLNVESPWVDGSQAEVDWAYVGVEKTADTTEGDQTVNIEVARTTKTISGKVTYAGTTTPVTDAQVNANLRRQSGWVNTDVNSQGEYELKVSGGEWELRVEPQWGENGQVSVDWAFTGFGEIVSFESNSETEEASVDLEVVKATATVKGQVVKPDGESLSWGWVECRTKDGTGIGGSIEQGSFSISVPAGSYQLEIFSDDPRYASPAMEPFSVESETTYNFSEVLGGPIEMVEKNSRIQGQLKDKDTGAGVGGVRVNAWSPEGAGWAESFSDNEGKYNLLIGPGEYEIMVEPGIDSGYTFEAGPPRVLSVEDGQTVKNINFNLTRASSRINGEVVDSEGNRITNFFGFAEAMEGDGDQPKPGPGAPAEGGTFGIAVPAGTWMVNVHTEPGSDYSSTGAKKVVIKKGETQTVRITMKQNDATISGVVRDEEGDPVTGIRAEVFAENGQGSFKFARVDPDDGTYELGVVGSDQWGWFLGVFVEPGSGYVMIPPSDNKMVVKSGERKTRNFELLKADASVSGQVVDPDGKGLSSVFVFVDSNMTEEGPVGDSKGPGIHSGDITRSDGTFTLEVPAGTYGVGSGAPVSLGYINPEFKEVTVEKGQDVKGVKLWYRAADATVTGQVTLDGAKNSAFVWAWSEDGAHSETMTRSGEYRLNVTSGTIWHIGADFEEEGRFYQSGEHIIDLTDRKSYSQDLVLEKASFEMPPSVSKTIEAAQGGKISMQDGFQVIIPAGAFGSSGSYTVTVSPTGQLAKERGSKPIAFGYEVSAVNSSGQSFTSTFNSNVRLIMPYTEDWLADLGITEDDLSASFFDSTSSAWQGVDTFTVNKDENQIVASVSHFTQFALVTGSADTIPPDNVSEVSLVGSNGAVEASWTNPSNADFDHVNIYRGTVEGEIGELVVSTEDSTVSSYTDSGLVNGTTYYYTLRTVDSRGNESTTTEQYGAAPVAELPATGVPLGEAVSYFSQIFLSVAGLAQLLRRFL